jgi:FkbM family methyltransferase
VSNRGRLIFDVGLHNGEDSAYYLWLGYDVVGIDANPLLCAECERRFAKEIGEGRMKVVNAGILERAGKFSFYRNLSDDGWSSFDRERGTRGGQWAEETVICTTTDDLVERYGRPFFIKVDIEGADMQVLTSIGAGSAPPYISLELNTSDPIVERLVELGYTAFKFVDGESYRPALPIFERDIGWRALRKIGRLIPLVRTGISKIPEAFRPKDEFNPLGKFSPDGYAFTKYSSGPFGERAAGAWLTPQKAISWFARLRDEYCREGKESALWWDVHARHREATDLMGPRWNPARAAGS